MDSEDRYDESKFVVRVLTEKDLEDVIRIDSKRFGRPRRDYFRLKLKQTLTDTSIRVGLAAESDGFTVGFLMGSVYYGDYGVPEPYATLEAIGVLPDFARRGVATALWEQFTKNLRAMRINAVQTQVDWSNWDLMTFLRRVGFAPAARMCLQRELDS